MNRVIDIGSLPLLFHQKTISVLLRELVAHGLRLNVTKDFAEELPGIVGKVKKSDADIAQPIEYRVLEYGSLAPPYPLDGTVNDCEELCITRSQSTNKKIPEYRSPSALPSPFDGTISTYEEEL